MSVLARIFAQWFIAISSFSVPMRAGTWILGAILLDMVLLSPGLVPLAGAVSTPPMTSGLTSVANWTFSCDAITASLFPGVGTSASWTWLNNGTGIPGATYSALCSSSGSQTPPANATGITVTVFVVPGCIPTFVCHDGTNLLTKSVDLTKSFSVKVSANGKGVYLTGMPSLARYNAKAVFSMHYA